MKVLASFVLIALVLICAFVLAVMFGGPKSPQSLAIINQPFASVDFSDLPTLQTYAGNDGAQLSYRHYWAKHASLKGSVVFIHGSSASSASMHVLCKAFANAGYDSFALDMRGHGASGVKGRIGYIGQLEDDVEAFVQSIHPIQPSTLAGFSSGGGFVLRFAGSAKQSLFQSTLLLSPFLGPDAPTYRPDAGGWVSVGIPRMVALSLLNQIGVSAFNDLIVIKFALDEHAKSLLTPEYSFALADNFRPHRNYLTDIRQMNNPCAILAGTADELFYTDKLDAIFKTQGKSCTVELLPGIGHIPLTLEPASVDAAVRLVDGLR